MKKILNIVILLVISAFISSQAIAKAPMQAQVESHRIPAGTILTLKTYNAISTKTSSVDDQFDAMLTEDKKIGKEIVLPQGTLFRGRVTKIEPSRILSKSAALYLNFDHVITPTGKQIQTFCGICGISMNPLGGITDNGNYGTAIKQNWDTAANMTKKATMWGVNIDNPAKYVVTPFSAIGGATVGTIYFVGDAFVDVFKKGSEVYMNQDTELKVMLTKPLDIPIN